MPKRGAIALLITGAALVLLLNFKTPEATASLGLGSTGGQSIVSTPAPTQAAGGTTTGTNGGSTATATPAATGGGSSATTALKSGTYTGSTVQTQFGPLQLQVTVSSGKITNVQALQYPSFHQRSVSINQYAIPVLVQETLQAQTAQVNAVSGATYTSEAYMQSLQSAIDQAHA